MKLGIYIFMAIGLMTCKSAKFDKNPPFKISGATYNNWTGGQPGVSGIRVIINFETKEDVQFDKIYFAKKEGTTELYERKGKVFLVGRIDTSNPKQRDLTLHIDSKKEVKNELPKEETKIPFELKENEAIISYVYKGKTHYYKVENIQQTKADYYP